MESSPFKEPTETQIIQNIRSELSARGMDQETLAGRVGIASSSMSRYLQQQRTMTVKTIGSIAEVFGMTLGEFFQQAARK